jgi:hypothetical protein
MFSCCVATSKHRDTSHAALAVQTGAGTVACFVGSLLASLFIIFNFRLEGLLLTWSWEELARLCVMGSVAAAAAESLPIKVMIVMYMMHYL